MRREKYASCGESPLNTTFRAFVISRCATDRHNTHTGRLIKMYFTHSVKIYMNIYIEIEI